MRTWLSDPASATTTVFRYIREAVSVLAAMSFALGRAVEVTRRKAFVIVDGMLLRIDRVGMASGRESAVEEMSD